MPRKQQTLADYVAIAISPILIMLLVGSLVFFLLQIMYQGGHHARVQWMLFWFVFATVLIARIGIEQGRAYAAMYAGAMSIACGLFAAKFLSPYLTGTLVLLGVIWWCSDKLTWDCTFIDDGDDASGEGLLQQAGIDRPSEETKSSAPIETEKQRRRRLRREQQQAEQLKNEPAPVTDRSDPARDAKPVKKRRKPRTHAPGVWVVYFSLLALPLFGLGQARLPMDQPAVRTYGFQLLWVYVASALGLLLTTSFLGLRRYLRQRNLQMPMRVTAGWLISGLSIVLGIMVLCLLIPRPQSDTSVTAWLDEFAEKHRASDHAMQGNDAGEGEGKRQGEQPENQDKPEEGEPPDRQQPDPPNDQPQENQPGKPADKKSPDGKPTGEPKSNGQQKSTDQQSSSEKSSSSQSENKQQQPQQQKQQDSPDKPQDQQSQSKQKPQQDQNQDEKNQEAKNRDPNSPPADQQDPQKNQQQEEEKQKQQGNPIAKNEEPPEGKGNPDNKADEPPSSPPPRGSWLSTLATGLKWLIYIVCGLLVLWLLWKNREAILRGAAEFLQAIANFWRNLFNFGGGERVNISNEGELLPASTTRRPFSDYNDPFLTGEARRMRPDALALYTWEAMLAFGADQGVALDVEQTAIEFGRNVEERFPELGKPISFLTQACSRILYSERPPIDFDIKPLELLWRGMTAITRGAREPSMS